MILEANEKKKLMSRSDKKDFI